MRISDLVTLNARRYPNKTAVAHKGGARTFKAYDERVSKTVHALRALGCEPGDRVALLSDGNVEAAELFFAVARGGFVLVPLNYRLTSNELAYIVNDSGAKVLIAKKDFLAKVSPVCKELGSVERYLSLGGDAGGFDSYEKLVDASSSEFTEAHAGDDDLVWLLYTSGTTGLPKAVMLTQRGLDYSAMTIPYGFDGLRRDDVGLLCTPPYALSFPSPILGHWYSGSGIVIVEKFEPLEVLKTIQEHRITTMMAVPTMLKMMIDHPDFFRYDLSSLRSIFYLGAPASPSLKTMLFNAFRGTLLQGYGQTESGGPMTLLEKADHMRPDKLGSVGRAMPGIDVRIVDDQGFDVPTGEPGEVAFKSQLAMKGYWNSPEANAQTIKNGWVHTGDVAKMDADGYVFLVDRKKDMVVTGGINVFPREIENVINTHPDVVDSAVIGVPDEHWGEIIKAIVIRQLDAKVDAIAIQALCRDQLAAFKVPKLVEFVDELPKNVAGKILKAVLREQHREQALTK